MIYLLYKGPEIPCLRIIGKCININTAVRRGNTKAYPGAAALGHPIPLLSFAADLTSRAAPSCSGSSDERSSSDSEKSVKREATLDSPLYL
uniref:Uncharacterized protein n=1 Tax=Vitis vinifera TaxID=29760 RepID=F6I3J9_VITVI